MPLLRIKRLAVLICVTSRIWAQAPSEAKKLVTLEKIEIHGSRFPEGALLHLSGLAVGEQVNDLIVTTACHKITSTGLVKSVDYAYDVYPDKPGVALILTLVDEKVTLPAKITPATDEERIWRALQAAEPLLTRELPRTEKALGFYSAHIERVLKSLGRDNEYVAPSVTGDANGAPTGIIFAIRSYKQTSAPRGQ